MRKSRQFFLFLAFCWSVTAQAEYKLGPQHQVKTEILEFDTVELLLDGKFAGFIYADSSPINFSKRYYVYATCPVDKSTNEPNDYCINWNIYDGKTRLSTPLTLQGLTFSSTPSFSWPYIAYVKVPNTITQQDFKKGFVEVSCAVIEWPKKNVIAQQKTQVDVGYFETDAPGSFYPPKFTQNKGSLEVTCLAYSGKDEGDVISTVAIPKKANK
ncbi:MAG: hypothetical protein ACXU8A_02285 [Burkholderiaceae bacterium]